MMYRRLSGWLVAALSALFLAALGPSLFLSFENNAWITKWYAVSEPWSALAWGTSAVMIMTAMIFDTRVYTDKYKFSSFFLCWSFGALMVSIGTAFAWLMMVGMPLNRFRAAATSAIAPFFAMILLTALFATIAGMLTQHMFQFTGPAPGEGNDSEKEVLLNNLKKGSTTGPGKRWRWHPFASRAVLTAT